MPWIVDNCGTTDERASQILAGGELSQKELRAVADTLSVSREELQYGRLMEDSSTDVTRENLRRLLEEAPRGAKKHLAAAMDVHPTTVSRWLSGEQRPPRGTWRALCRYFGLHPDTDLSKVPVFLEHRPLGDRGRRDWLRDRIEKLPSEELSVLYPAFERSLEPR